MDRALTIGISLVAFDKMSRVIGDATGKSIQHFTRLQEKIKQVSEKLAEIGTVSYFAGQQIISTMNKPIAAFSDLEDAIARSRVAFMTSGGDVDQYFSEIEGVARRLGNELPGTTRDFTLMASRLKELGIASETIARGGLEATAYLKVLMGDLAPEAAAEMTATFSQSLGIAKEDFVSFVDMIQRAKFAFGLDPQMFAYTLKYVGPIGKQLGIIGLEGSKSLIALSGMLSQAGIKGEQLGTSLRSILLELPNVDKKITKSKEISEILQRYGIGLMFFKEGRFLGMENLVYQLEKLKALTTEERIEVIKALFGTESASALSEAVGKGLKGLQQAHDEMQKQASLQERLNVVMGTFKNLWEAATGTFTNVLAAIGGSMQAELKWVAKAFNSISESILNFSVKHKVLTKVLSIGTVTIGGLLVSIGALAIALSVIMRAASRAISGIIIFKGALVSTIHWIKLKTAALWNLIYTKIYLDKIQYRGGFYQALQFWLMTTKYHILSAISAMKLWITTQYVAFKTNFLTISGLKALAAGFGRHLVKGIKAAILAIRTLSLTLLTNPIGWVAMAIGLAAMLIYKFWAPISGFFKGLWTGIKEGLKGLEPAWDVFKKIAPLFFPIIMPLRLIYNLIKWLIRPVEDTGKAAEALGLRFGRVIGNILSSILTLPTRMFEAGAAIIESLWKGMMSAINKPVEAIKGVAQRIRALLPFSPAKEGPLADLHRVRLIETIVEGINPEPLFLRLKETFGKVTDTIGKFVQPSFSVLMKPATTEGINPEPLFLRLKEGYAGQPHRANALGTAGHIFNISVNVTVNNAAGLSANELAQQTAMEIEKMMRRRYS